MPSDLIGYLNTRELDDPFIRKQAEITSIGRQLETMDPSNLLKMQKNNCHSLNKSMAEGREFGNKGKHKKENSFAVRPKPK